MSAYEPCGSRRYRKIIREGRGGLPILTYQCRRCGRQFRSTSGTIFEGSRFPLSLWFAALGLPSNGARDLAERLRIPYKKAWTLSTKIKYEYEHNDLLRSLYRRIIRIAYNYWVLSRPAKDDLRPKVQLLLKQFIESGMSQRAIAKKIGCSQYAVHSWLHGKVRPLPIFEYRLHQVAQRCLTGHAAANTK